MLLGRTSDTLVLFDCEEDLTIRMPAESRLLKAE